MKAYQDISRLINNVKDPDDLMHFLKDAFGSQLREKTYYIRQIKNLKHCKEVGDDAMLLQELLMIKSSLEYIGELSVVGEDLLDEYILKRLTDDSVKKW